MYRSIRFSLAPLLIALALGGCGSKISEANYYRVQYGMSEEDVDDLLGPPREETAVAPPPAATSPTTTRAVAQKVKTWAYGGLTIRVEFEDGVVVGRSSDGIAGEPPATSRR